MRPKRRLTDRLPLLMFLGSSGGALFVWGVAAGRYEVFPFKMMQGLVDPAVYVARDIGGESWFFRENPHPSLGSVYDAERAFPGLNMVVRVGRREKSWVEVVDLEGTVLHAWETDWHGLWPNAEHVPAGLRPKAGSTWYAHGAVILEDGDVVFNFEHLGMIRLSREGEVVWRLPYRTHHSLELGPDGNLWACGQRLVEEVDGRYPERVPPYDEFTLLQVSPDGQILRELSVADILYENGYAALVHSARFLQRNHATIKDDRLHLNDVEPFPRGLTPGFFGPGDVAVSLRNVGVVFVVELETRKIKFFSSGRFSRQHDPDFVSGDALSIFDNESGGGGNSRIVLLRAPSGDVEVAYEARDGGFFTDIMGKHQWLPNGDVLVTESRAGRAFEVAPDGEIVWQYVNETEPGVVGLVTEVTRLSPEAASNFLEDAPAGEEARARR